MQSIVGNNHGAQVWARSDKSQRMGLVIALAHCATMQLIFLSFSAPIARLFVSDPAVAAEYARIVPITTSILWVAGPTTVIASYFQAIGSASRAAILGLTRPFMFSIPLTLCLALRIGVIGIWIAGPVGEVLLLLLTFAVLSHARGALGLKRGLFTAPAGPHQR